MTTPRGTPDAEARPAATSNTLRTSEAIDAVLAFVGPVGDDSGMYPDGLTAEGMDTLTQLLWAVVRAASREAGAPDTETFLLRRIEEAEGLAGRIARDAATLARDLERTIYRASERAGSPPTSGEGR